MPTTIQIDKLTKEKLDQCRLNGETYQDVINRLYDIAVKEQLRKFYSLKAIPLDEAIRRHQKIWADK
ncbi:MAG TPA: hypothetical protein VJB66_05240 [Candidatus Nanoarchaeia archaeon]|nr:hypothetical protein [Candidatus Nanoarchaeia archaeon]